MSEKPEQRAKVTEQNIEQLELPVKVTDRQSKSKDSASLAGVSSGF